MVNSQLKQLDQKRRAQEYLVMKQLGFATFPFKLILAHSSNAAANPETGKRAENLKILKKSEENS